MGRLAPNAEKQMTSNLKLGWRGKPAADKNMSDGGVRVRPERLWTKV